MKKLCNSGFKISNADQKALEHYLLIPANTWATNALKGMINKAVKTIMREGFEAYKKTITGNVSADYAVIIPGILNLPGFKLEKIQVPFNVTVKRTEVVSQEIWANGFDVEDYEEQALKALYENPEDMLRWFMENKIYQRRKAFVKEKEVKFIQEKKAFPANEDAFINFAVAEPGYKNRAQSEAI